MPIDDLRCPGRHVKRGPNANQGVPGGKDLSELESGRRQLRRPSISRLSLRGGTDVPLSKSPYLHDMKHRFGNERNRSEGAEAQGPLATSSVRYWLYLGGVVLGVIAWLLLGVLEVSSWDPRPVVTGLPSHLLWIFS